MEMQMEVKDELSTLMERVSAAAGALEQAAERLTGVEVRALEAADADARTAELHERLREAEATIASLRAQATRKTEPVTGLMAKESVAFEAGALDAALGSLSIEQRIAVKSGLLRAGLI